MKAPALFCILLCVAPCVAAKPWYKDWKVWAVIGSSIASSAVATKEAHDCRERVGISFCSGGYGPFAAREAVRMAGSVGLDAIGIWGRHLGIKWWSVPALSFTAYNTYDAYDQTLKGCPAGEEPVYGTKYNCQPDDYDSWKSSSAKRLTYIRVPSLRH